MRGPGRRGSLAGLLTRHWLIAVLVAAGLVLRIAESIAYRPALVYNGDSFSYLHAAEHVQPGWFHPLGYSVFLRIVTWGHVGPVPIVQHVLGIGISLALYAALLRLGVRPIVAALGAVPLLLDTGLLTLEQYVLAETLFIVLALIAIGILVWPRARRPSVAACAGAGLVLAAVVLTRTVGLVIAVPLVLLVAARRWGWLRAGALVAATALPLVAYAGWYHASRGPRYALEGSDSRLLYAQLATFADCKGLSIPPDERRLCPDPQHRLSNGEYAWATASPLHSYRPPAGRDLDSVLRDFDKRVMFGDPLSWLRVSAKQFALFFRPARVGGKPSLTQWRFQSHLKLNTTLAAGSVDATLAQGNHGSKRPHAPVGWLAAYSIGAFVPGPLVALALLGGLVLAFFRRWEPDADRRAAAWALAASALLLVGFTAFTAPVNYRYFLPAVAFAGPAGALVVDAVLNARGRRRVAVRPAGEAVTAPAAESSAAASARPDSPS